MKRCEHDGDMTIYCYVALTVSLRVTLEEARDCIRGKKKISLTGNSRRSSAMLKIRTSYTLEWTLQPGSTAQKLNWQNDEVISTVLRSIMFDCAVWLLRWPHVAMRFLSTKRRACGYIFSGFVFVWTTREVVCYYLPRLRRGLRWVGDHTPRKVARLCGFSRRETAPHHCSLLLLMKFLSTPTAFLILCFHFAWFAVFITRPSHWLIAREVTRT